MKKHIILTILLCGIFLSGCSCVHHWQDATCDAPQTCILCGFTQGTALEHIPDGEATCDNPVYCTLCSKMIQQSLGHDWKEATKDSPMTCTRCNETIGSPLAASDVYTAGKARHNGKTFLMNPSDYSELFNEYCNPGSIATMYYLFPNLEQLMDDKDDNCQIYDLLGVSGQQIRLECDSADNITRIIVTVNSDEYSADDYIDYMTNCVVAYIIANGNITADEFTDQMIGAKESGPYANTASGCHDGVAYHIEVRYNEITMEIWVDENAEDESQENINETADPGLNPPSNLTAEEAAVVGEWNLTYGYNASESLILEDSKLTKKLFLNEDMTGKIVDDAEVITFSWHYIDTYQAQYGNSQYMTFTCTLASGSTIPEEKSIDSFQFDVETTDPNTIFITMGNWLYLYRKV